MEEKRFKKNDEGFICKNCGKDEAHCTCEKPKFETLNQEEETLTRDIVLSDGSILPAMSVEIKD